MIAAVCAGLLGSSVASASAAGARPAWVTTRYQCATSIAPFPEDSCDLYANAGGRADINVRLDTSKTSNGLLLPWYTRTTTVDLWVRPRSGEPRRVVRKTLRVGSSFSYTHRGSSGDEFYVVARIDNPLKLSMVLVKAVVEILPN